MKCKNTILAEIRRLEQEVSYEKLPADTSYFREKRARWRSKATNLPQKQRRITHRKEHSTLDVMRTVAESVLLHHKKSLVYIDTPSPIHLASHIPRGSTLPAWRDLPDRLYPLFYNLALNEAEGDLKLHPFTFVLSSEVTNNPGFTKNPATYLHKRLSTALERKLNRSPDYWFTLESGTQFGHSFILPHAHGTILLHPSELDAVREVFHQINGIQKKIAKIKSLSKKAGLPLSDTVITAQNFIKHEIKFSQQRYIDKIRSSGKIYAVMNWPLYSTKFWTSDRMQWLGEKSHCAATHQVISLARDYYEKLRDELKILSLKNC